MQYKSASQLYKKPANLTGELFLGNNFNTKTKLKSFLFSIRTIRVFEKNKML